MHIHRLPGEYSGLAAHICPLCGRSIPPEVHPLSVPIDAPVMQRLKSANPGWREETGACQECIENEIQAAWRERSLTSLHEELLLPYPVYDSDQLRLIPTPQRVMANPKFSGAGVTIAFLDSGFYPHPDLTRPQNRILAYVDATGEQPEVTFLHHDQHVTNWHGLMTSCVAAGNGSLSGGLYQGIAYKANLVLVKTGNRRSRHISDEDILRALTWVVENQERFKIAIVNISLGGDYPTTGELSPLDALVEEAVLQGMVVVAAAGNDGKERLVSPASAPSAITVGGLDDRNSFDARTWRMYPSNYGHGANDQPKPELVAPARWLAAPILPGTFVSNEARLIWQADHTVSRMLKMDADRTLRYKGRAPSSLEEVYRKIRRRMVRQKYIHPHYQHVDGTSMAAPVVSAIVAQMLEANPNLSPAQVRSILTGTATPLDFSPFEKRGAGLVNAARALGAAQRAANTDWKELPFSPQMLPEQITFYYFDPGGRATQVALISSFNQWNPRGYDFRKKSSGLWQLTIPTLPAGQYRYKYLVDGVWLNDPENPERIEDGHGGFTSILVVVK